MKAKGLFVKKPVPVFAEQWYPGEEVEGVEEIRHTQLGPIGQITDEYGSVEAMVSPGSYIIRMPYGTLEVFGEDEFKKLFEEHNDKSDN